MNHWLKWQIFAIKRFLGKHFFVILIFLFFLLCLHILMEWEAGDICLDCEEETVKNYLVPSFRRTDVDGTMRILQKEANCFWQYLCLKYSKPRKKINPNTRTHSTLESSLCALGNKCPELFIKLLPSLLLIKDLNWLTLSGARSVLVKVQPAFLYRDECLLTRRDILYLGMHC